jgi:rhodanese-related sulfurtransferase
MTLDELARLLAATTMFSPLGRARLLALLTDSPRRRASGGDWLADSPDGLCSHIVLLAGEVETWRSWIGADGLSCSQSRRVGLSEGGPGFALISAASHQHRVQALTDVDYLAVDSDRLDDLLGWGHLGAFVLPEPHLKVFHRLPLENVAKAINCLVERPVEAGETIVTQGEPGDGYYIILAGEADVLEADASSGVPVRVNRLGDGDSFGEEALLADSRRTATVTMTTPGRLLLLSRSDFDALLSPPLVETIDAGEARKLLALGTARLLDCRGAAEHDGNRIPGARLVPLESLRHEGVFALEPDLHYIVYCGTGRRSRAAAFLLAERGIQARSLAGGMASWPYEVEGAAV